MRSLTRALVVGGAGFVGGWLVDALNDHGVHVTVVDNLSGSSVGRSQDAELIKGDVLDLDLPVLLREGRFDAVFHLAGTAAVPPSVRAPIEDLTRNTITLLSMLEALRVVDRPCCLVFVSSAAVYGNSERVPMDEEHPLRPISPYGISKLAGEQYVSLYARLHGVPGLSVRPFSLYGPRQRKLVVYDLFTRACGGEDPLVVLGSADVTRDFVFITDAARGIVRLAEAAPAAGEAYNIASGVGVTLGELVSTLIEVAGVDVECRFTGQVRPGDPLRWEGDPSRAQRLGVECPTSLREGLAQTAAWFLRDATEATGSAEVD
jgi:UDP-glucose 4-epimerase